MYYVICDEKIIDTRRTRPIQDGLQAWADSLGASCYVIGGDEIDMVAVPRRRFNPGDEVVVTQDIPGVIVGSDEYGRLSKEQAGRVHCYIDDGRIAVIFDGIVHTFAPNTTLISKQ